MDDDPFTTDDLNNAIAKQRNNKTPGPDGLRLELIKYLDANNRQTLLDQINNVHHTGKLEPALHDAQVVSIFKKGDSSKLENYRPISLLPSFCKFIATRIKSRLEKGLDEWICDSNMILETEEVLVMRFYWHVDYRILLKKTEAILSSFYWTERKLSTKSAANVY